MVLSWARGGDRPKPTETRGPSDSQADLAGDRPVNGSWHERLIADRLVHQIAPEVVADNARQMVIESGPITRLGVDQEVASRRFGAEPASTPGVALRPLWLGKVPAFELTYCVVAPNGYG
jgi:hypothetical protein